MSQNRLVSAFGPWLATAMMMFSPLFAAENVVTENAVTENAVTVESLLEEMTTPSHLSQYPSPYYTCRQFSSYDRAAKSPSENWFANGDASQFLRSETNSAAGNRTEWVLMETTGPGSVVRFWITSHHYVCNLYIYIDGETTPAVSGNIGEIIGGNALTESLAEVTARGRNLYLPIPYAKSIKITVDQMPVQRNLYYQINYRTYEAGTNVQSFSVDQAKKSPLNQKIDLPQRNTDSVTSVLPDGSNCINQFSVAVKSQDLATTLRQTILKMTFDGQNTVWCPLGDFFGSGIGPNSCRTFWTEVTPDPDDANSITMTCFWPMPYRQTAQVEIASPAKGAPQGTDVYVPAEITWNCKTSPYQWTDRSMYFHCDWKQDREIETIAGTGTCDWNYVQLTGKGVYVGDVLSVLNRNRSWWGEGDEKIYIDGETFPSHFGTGTEDYYGYAWCTPEKFNSLWRAQPRAEGPGNFGNTTNLRFRSLDAIPFASSLKFDMEVWHWSKTSIDYAVAVIWYGLPNAQVPNAQPLERRIEEALCPVSYKTPFVFQMKSFKVLNQPNGSLQSQGMSGFKLGKWENNEQLWWTGTKAGDELKLGVTVVEGQKTGTMVVHMTAAIDYGQFEFLWDGKPVGNIVDLFAPEGVHNRQAEFSMENCDTSAGEHVLTVRVAGKNAKSTGTMFGTDRIEWK